MSLKSSNIRNNFGTSSIKHLIAIVFIIIYCSISFVNHYSYRTYALDLGLFNQSIWNYANFQNANYTIANELYTCQLGDHFSLYFILISPFYWLFGSYTLLIFQIVSIIFGGYGVYQYAKLKYENNEVIPLLFLLQFYGIYGIYSALSYDYHDNVVAAMFVPWFIYYFESKKKLKTVLFFLLILISKENMALWLFFICLGIVILNLKNKKQLLFSSLLGLLALVYFIAVIKYVLPTINGKHGYVHLSYSVLGDNPLKTFISNPLQLIKSFFCNHLSDHYFDGIKEETFYLFLFSGGVLLFFRPAYLIMLIPIFAQKMFSDDPGKWGMNGHYSVEFAPILTLGAISAISYFRSNFKLTMGIVLILILFTYKCNYDKYNERTSLNYSKLNSQFLSEAHYKSAYDVNAINEAIKLLPSEAKISATSVLLPHIPNHKFIYQYPVNKDANCFFLLEHPEIFYLFSQQDLDNQLSILRTDSNWISLYDKNGVCLFTRK